jgi:hypothetical protein
MLKYNRTRQYDRGVYFEKSSRKSLLKKGLSKTSVEKYPKYGIDPLNFPEIDPKSGVKYLSQGLEICPIFGIYELVICDMKSHK